MTIPLVLILAFCSTANYLLGQPAHKGAPTNAPALASDSKAAEPSHPEFGPAIAFRNALGALKYRVDFLQESGHIFVRRNPEGVWLVHIKGYSGIEAGGITLEVTPSSVRFHGTNSTSLEIWVDSKTPVQTKTTRKMRAEVAFRKAIEAYAARHSTMDLMDDTGRITLWRDKHGWCMDLFGYMNMPLGGYWITISDDGDVKVVHGL